MGRAGLNLAVCLVLLGVSACAEVTRLSGTAVDPTSIEVPDGAEIYLRIFKAEAVLEAWVRIPEETDYLLLKSWPICSFSGTLGPKLREGDLQAPEGFYEVRSGSLNPNSSYHLSFNLGFPNRYDRAHGRTGSFLMVHGDCVSIGCYAMTDEGIEEIYGLVEKALSEGQSLVPVHIFPFQLTQDNLSAYEGHEWYGFWQNLAEGDQVFLETGLPPDVSVANKRYVFMPQ